MPINWKKLRESYSIETKAILYIYSMETFLPQLMNQACRLQDNSKIFTLGPFAHALNSILSCGFDKNVLKSD